MNQYKSILTSKTFWGSVIQLVGALGLSPIVDVSVTASAIVLVIGFAVAIYGRITAKKIIS